MRIITRRLYEQSVYMKMVLRTKILIGMLYAGLLTGKAFGQLQESQIVKSLYDKFKARGIAKIDTSLSYNLINGFNGDQVKQGVMDVRLEDGRGTYPFYVVQVDGDDEWVKLKIGGVEKVVKQGDALEQKVLRDYGAGVRVIGAGSVANDGQVNRVVEEIYGEFISTGISDNEISSGVIDGFSLEQNYPNPFNGSTKIAYEVPRREKVEINVYDAKGRKVRGVVDEFKNPGKYGIVFDSENLISGVYFLVMNAGGSESFSKKMIVVK